MYQQRIEEIKAMIQQETFEFRGIPNPKDSQKNKLKRKLEHYRAAIMYLETTPKIEFIQSEINRMIKQIEVRHEAQEQIKSDTNFTSRSKKEMQEALNNADYKQQREHLKMLQFCIQGVK
jgi:16S rRNA C1402 (ribose-2'-O) methylase RsmI